MDIGHIGLVAEWISTFLGFAEIPNIRDNS